MEEPTALYLSGMSLVTALGADVTMVSVAANAGINRYALSRFSDHQGNPIRLATVPEGFFEHNCGGLDEGDIHSEAQDYAIKMALFALSQLVEQGAISQDAVPLLLAMPEPELQCDCLPPAKFKANVKRAGHNWFDPQLVRSLTTGRAAGIEGVEFAYEYLAQTYPQGIVIGASDSPRDFTRLAMPESQGRLLSLGPCDGYVPGEGAAFIALTADPKHAMARKGQVIRLAKPGLAQESGHWFSDEPYRGEGLDIAFKRALKGYAGPPIHSLYSSMNGERYWAKEYGVASIRNQTQLGEPRLMHPAEYYGDLGSATAPALIALAAHDLLNNPNAQAHLVYSSSDTALRGAVVVEKCRP